MIIILLILVLSALLVYQMCTYKQYGVKEGLSNESAGKALTDMVLDDHEEIIALRAELDMYYSPLIENQKGEPTNLLSRLTMLESDVNVLKKNALNSTENALEEMPAAPQVEAAS